MSTRYTIEVVAELQAEGHEEEAVVIVAAKQPVEVLKAALEAVDGIASVTVTKKMAAGRSTKGVRKPRKQKLQLAAAAD